MIKYYHMKKTTLVLFAMALFCGCSAQSSTLTPTQAAIPYTNDLATSQIDTAKSIESEISSGSYTLESPYVMVDPYGLSPLSVLVAFENPNDTEYTFTVKSNIGTMGDLVFNGSTIDGITYGALTGLNVDGSTTIDINGNDGSTHSLSVQAAEIPEDAFVSATITIDQGNLPENTLLITSPSSTGYISGYDSYGQLRFIIDQMLIWDTNVTADGYLTVSNETLLDLPYYFSGFYCIDFTGHIAKQYVLEGGYHHDVDQMPNGHYLIASNDLNRNTVEDVIKEIDDQTGEVVNTIDLSTILDMDTGKSINWTESDWFHNNSVEYDPIDQTLLLSGRHQDVVVELSYPDGELVGLIGSPEGWSEQYQPYFYTPIGDEFEYQWAQHAASYNDQHQLMLFDNGMFRSKEPNESLDAADNYSRFVLYELNKDDHTISQVFEYGKERGSAYYSPYISDVDQIEDDTYLITSGGISYLDGQINNMPSSLTSYDTLEAYLTLIDDGQAIFELMLPTNIYRGELIDVSTLNFSGFDYTGYGALEETPYTTDETIDLSTALPVSETQSLGFTLTQDDYRILFDGNVDRKASVAIIIDDGSTIKVYPLQNHQEVGMCVSIFNEADETNHLLKSIALSGLTNNAHVYYQLDDVIYDSGYVYTTTH